MLERATVSLKSGAVRDPLRCAQRATKSKRALHSTFWNHGAGDLDLPPWAASMLPAPKDLHLREHRTPARSARGEGHKYGELHTGRGAVPEGVFLDFLYPPRALAWQHTANGQQWQRWEKRNARRLPEGFVLASRGYASRSRGCDSVDRADEETPESRIGAGRATGVRKGHVRQKNRLGLEDLDGQLVEELEFGKGQIDSKRWNHDRSKRKQISNGRFRRDDIQYVGESGLANSEISKGNGGVELGPSEFTSAFQASPGDLAEAGVNSLQKLRSILTHHRTASSPQKSRTVTETVLQLYEDLDQSSRDDVRLKSELLVWMALQHNEVAESHFEDLFASIPANQRALPVYQAALSIFLRLERFDAISKLHTEALGSLENGHQVSKVLFRYAVDHGQWALAMQTYEQHHAAYADRQSQQRLFWLHVSDIPNLFNKATDFVTYAREILKSGPMSRETRDFCVNFIREAIALEFFRRDGSQPRTKPTTGRPPMFRVRALFSLMSTLMDKDAPQFFETTLSSLLKSKTGSEFARYHNLISYIYFGYREMSGVQPSRNLLMEFLVHLTKYMSNVRRIYRGVDIDVLVQDWKHYHGKVDLKAVHLLMSTYAFNGSVKSFETWLDYLRETYPSYADQKDVLWTTIYLHARRANLDEAQRAFAEVKRIATEHGDSPDLKCWNVLLHAHERADDLDGAITNWFNLLEHAKLTPDAYSFHPLLVMLAKRGDVSGIEDLLEQYDDLIGEEKECRIIGSLMTAHCNNGDMRTAEAILKETIEKLRAGKVYGSLTGCFNILLTGHALRRNVDATMAIYEWMRNEKIRLNADSFSALILSLTLHRQTQAAYKILTTSMKEYGIQPSGFHYAIIMGGYINQGMFEEALKVYDTMQRLNIKPTASTSVVFLKAKAIRESYERGRGSNPDVTPQPSLEDTIEELQRLSGDDGLTIADKEFSFRGTMRLTGADVGSHFDFLIFIHGERRCFEVVQELHRRYLEASRKGERGETPSIKLLATFISVYNRAGKYKEVEQFWQLAKEQADEITRMVTLPDYRNTKDATSQNTDALQLQPLVESPEQTEPEAIGWQPNVSEKSSQREQHETPNNAHRELPLNEPVLPSPSPAPGRRHVLTRPLRLYLGSLYDQGRTADAINVFSDLLRQGYTFDNPTWNSLIEHLCSTSPPLALLAYTLTERFLIPQFPGWQPNKRHWPLQPQARAEGLTYIRARYLRPHQLMPMYRTMVRLGAALLALRRLEAAGKKSSDMPQELRKYVGTSRSIRSAAPNTLLAVQSMPRLRDQLQARLLRREDV